MFARLMDFLKDLPGAQPAKPGAADDDPLVAAAALMFHVMDADGERLEVERRTLEDVLSRTFNITGQDLKRVVAAGERADQEAVDLYAFTSVLSRHLDDEARIAFIEILWEIVYADGVMNEVEDNVVWRVAELIGVERRDRVDARLKVRGRGADDTVVDEED